MAEISLENLWNANRFHVNMGTIAFFFLLNSILFLWLFFVGQNIDKTYADVHIWLVLFSTFILVYLLFLSGATGKLGQGHFVFLPTGKTRIAWVLISLFIALAIGGLFAFVNLSVVPVREFSFTFNYAGDYADFLNVSKFFVNFSIVPAINEELAFGLLFIAVFDTLTLLFNRSFDPNKAKMIFLISLAFVSFSFGVEHYFAVSTRQSIDFQAYSANPTDWSALNPSKPIPQDPTTPSGLFQIITSLFVASFFRIIILSVLLISADLFLAIKGHAFVNAFILVLDTALPTLGQWSYLLLIIALFVFLDYLENIFTKAGDALVNPT